MKYNVQFDSKEEMDRYMGGGGKKGCGYKYIYAGSIPKEVPNR